MARASVTSPQAPDPNLINLSRILSRLESIILAPDAAGESRLRKSSLERSRVGANLEYARTLLLRLEHESSTIKLQSRKQGIQAELLEKRVLVKRLNERLRELGQLDDGTGILDEEDIEDLLGGDDDEGAEEGHVVPQNSFEVGARTTSISSSDPGGSHPVNGEARPYSTGAPTETNSSLRARHKPLDQSKDTGVTSSSQAHPALSSTEAVFSHNRLEQEELTGSLLSLAQKLREETQAFSSSLESEKEVLGRTGEGLEKNTSVMQAAEKRMGALRRMTEGRGWWGRMMMYAWIVGLMMIALVIVGFLPKLRF
ncbi:MAG: hypothetical protein M1832_002317 [Thelocarpon impressellum]|nr:MAG: hypothetical protein M1832_002317 [Thelocarpon impressellum]